MGRRHGPRGKGARAAMKHRQLGIEVEGLTKPMLDAANEHSKHLYRLGVGVLVQEEDRSRRIYESVRGGWTPGRVFARRRARSEWRMWEARLRHVTGLVAEDHAPR